MRRRGQGRAAAGRSAGQFWTVTRSRVRRELATSGGLDRYQRATLGFGLHYEQAVLAWMDELPALLTGAVR